MRLSTAPLLTTLLAATRVLSQDDDAGDDCASLALSAIPACAQPCFVDGAPTIGCSELDFACLCRQPAALYAAVESCVASSCDASAFQDVIDGAESVCACTKHGSRAVVSGSLAPSGSVPPSVVPPSVVPPSVGPTSIPPATTASSPTHSATPSVIFGGAPRSRADLGLVVGAFFAFVLL